MINANKKSIAVLMYMLIALGGVVVDIVVPSLPSIQSAFSTTEVTTQWAFSAAIFGFGTGQIIAGFIVDAFGRKRPMVIGGIALSASLMLSITSSNIYALIIIRLFEGIAVSFIAVGGRAAIKDMYHGVEYLKAVNWITISFAMGITFSPFVGGYIEEHFGWKMVFVFLGCWTLVGTLLLTRLFDETHTETRPLSGENIKASLVEILLNRSFQKVALICGIFYSILPAFNTVAPFLIQNTLGYSPVFYGYIALLLGACWLAGNFINRVTFNLQLKVKVCFSLTLSLLAIAFGVTYQVLFGLNLIAFVIPVSIVICSLGLLFPLFLGKALSPFGHMAGIANALVFSGCWLATAAISFIASFLSSSTAIPTMVLYAILLTVVVLLSTFEKNTPSPC
ncbi:Putative drug resistance transporter, Bcr/CflA family protein [Vibrio harveyi]|uniref:MFS transporter n=1 Tax=Vibrio harveyi TaxID=669 RepID=UPI002ADB1C02|nr:MFS transporter [Vibrio harveyi]CAK6715312.1 Putative drug resistance transporter, Bcr/CflA family protein [Vibrio harveyi]